MREGKKSERITVWVGRDEKKRLAREAKRLKVALSNLVGDRLTRERDVFIAELDRDQLVDTRFQLHKIGADLGHISRALSVLCAAEKGGPAPDLGWLREVAEELRRRLRKLDQDLYEIRPFKPGK
jgi:hypothetical protein